MSEKIFDLEDRLVEFSCLIIELVEVLPPTRAGNYIAGQLIRCGLAPALLYGEAQSAESRMDFVHKMKIVLKELKETIQTFCHANILSRLLSVHKNFTS